MASVLWHVRSFRSGIPFILIALSYGVDHRITKRVGLQLGQSKPDNSIFATGIEGKVTENYWVQ
jgi:hypothetical protein